MNIVVGGAAGQGMETIGHLLGRTLSREGYGVLLTKDYMSRVRGGHNFTVLQVAREAPWSAVSNADILVALNEETYFLHRDSLAENSRVVHDPGLFALPSAEKRSIPVNLQSLAREAGGTIMSNTVACGAVLALLGLGTEIMESLLKE